MWLVYITIFRSLVNLRSWINHNFMHLPYVYHSQIDRMGQNENDPAVEDEVKYRYNNVILHYRKSFIQDNAQRYICLMSCHFRTYIWGLLLFDENLLHVSITRESSFMVVFFGDLLQSVSPKLWTWGHLKTGKVS